MVGGVAFGADPGEGAVCPLVLPRAYFRKDEGNGPSPMARDPVRDET